MKQIWANVNIPKRTEKQKDSEQSLDETSMSVDLTLLEMMLRALTRGLMTLLRWEYSKDSCWVYQKG
jgi:hypothetical protein